jgi:hypothetical protein
VRNPAASRHCLVVLKIRRRRLRGSVFRGSECGLGLFPLCEARLRPGRFQEIHRDNGAGYGILAGPVKPSEYPDKDERTVPFSPAEKETAIVPKTPDAAPQNGGKPAGPTEPAASRNLALAITCIVLAAIGLWLGSYYAGATALRTLVASVGACGLVLLFAQRRLLAQKHGVLFALGAAALFGAAIPWVEGSFRKLDGIARERLGDNSEVTNRSVPPPPPTAATAPPAPPTIALPGSEEAEENTEPKKPVLVMRKPKQGGPAAASLASDVQGTARELIVPAPPKDAGRLIELKQDMKVELDGRPTIIRAGTLAPFKELSDGKVTFVAGDYEVSVDMEHVSFKGVSQESPGEITKLAQREAVLRYPKLGEDGSKENTLFLTRKKELEMEPDGKEFFKNPKWPLLLAEQIASQENWVRVDEQPVADNADDETVPANEAPAKVPPLLDDAVPPPAVPQENEPAPVPAN